MDIVLGISIGVIISGWLLYKIYSTMPEDGM